jgi:hypothetical protein
MLSHQPSAPARRTIRANRARLNRRRYVAIAATLSMGLIAGAAVSATTPTASAEAFAPGAFTLASYSTAAEPTVAVADDALSTAARDAIEAATVAVDDATAITTAVEKSKLKIKDAPASVDTADLETAAEELADAADTLPAPFLPSLTSAVTELTESVDTETEKVTEGLDAAKKLKAKKIAEEKARKKAEAEAKAKAEAEAAAAAEQAAASASSSSSSSESSSASAPAAAIPSGSSSGDNSPAGAKASAYAMMASRGWDDGEYSCLVSLWQKESGWNYKAYNASSGATGIPQALPGSKMASAGGDWATNAATQVKWGLGYIEGRYGSPCDAWGHSQSYGWY